MKWERIEEIMEALSQDEDATDEKYPAIEVSEARDWQEVRAEYSEEIAQAAHALDVQPANVDEAYAGEFGSAEDFARDLVEQINGLPKDLPTYIHIDWERTASDLMMDYGESNGHYFRSL